MIWRVQLMHFAHLCNHLHAHEHTHDNHPQKFSIYALPFELRQIASNSQLNTDNPLRASFGLFLFVADLTWLKAVRSKRGGGSGEVGVTNDAVLQKLEKACPTYRANGLDPLAPHVAWAGSQNVRPAMLHGGVHNLRRHVRTDCHRLAGTRTCLWHVQAQPCAHALAHTQALTHART